MAFCEQCGARLTTGARFCEECGTPVEVGISEVAAQSSSESKNWYNSFAVFKSGNWKKEWQKAAEDASGEELGIMMTSEASLAAQLGVDADDLRDTIASYMRSADKRGVHYYYLDLEDNAIGNVEGSDVAGIVSLLRRIVEVARPKYLFVLGNEEIIDVATWDNEANDSDPDVYSDLVYSTLDTISPWEGQEFNASEALRVGRLPTTNGRFGDFTAYFENAMQGIGNVGKIRPYGLSALVWKEESNEEYSSVSDSKVDTCPEVGRWGVDKLIVKAEPNLFFFNLHGSDDTRFWYGQKGGEYPKAMSPDVIKEFPRAFFLGVEACYGARYIELEPEESIVKTALANKCLALLGSSKIAYGTSEPEGSCADIVIGEFIRQIAKGDTAGDAHIAGLKKLTSASEMDDSDIKTLAEFALYGDPSACTGKNRNLGAMKGFMKKFGGVSKGIHIPMPDVRRATKLLLAEVDAKIERAIDDYVVASLMPAIKQKGFSVEQKVFRMQNGRMNQKMYLMETDEHIRQIAKVYFDDNGKVHKALLSK